MLGFGTRSRRLVHCHSIRNSVREFSLFHEEARSNTESLRSSAISSGIKLRDLLEGTKTSARTKRSSSFFRGARRFSGEPVVDYKANGGTVVEARKEKAEYSKYNLNDRGGFHGTRVHDHFEELRHIDEFEGTERELKELQRTIYKRIRTLGSRGDWKGALNEYEAAAVNRMAMSDHIHNGVMVSLASAGRWDVALNFLGRLIKEGASLSVDVYNSACNACARGEKWREAIKLLRGMQQYGPKPNIITYACVVNACSKSGLFQQAISLLREAEESGLKLTQSIYNCTMAACNKARNFKMTEILFDEMKEKGVDPDELNYHNLFLSYLYQKKNGEMLRQLFELEETDPSLLTVVIYNTVLRMCASALWHTKSLEILEHMRKTGIHPDGESYLLALRSFNQVNTDQGVRRMLDLLTEMDQLNIYTSDICYATAIVTCSESGHLDKALDLFEQLQKLTILRETHLLRAVEGILSACSRSGDFEVSIKVMQQVNKLGLKITHSAKLLELSLESCAVAGKPGKCSKLIENLEEKSEKITSPMLTSYIKAHAMRASESDWQECKRLLFETHEKYKLVPEKEAVRCTIEACRNAGKRDEMSIVEASARQS